MPSAAVPYLSLIPEELLALILFFVMVDDRAFFIERCIYPLPNGAAGKPEERVSADEFGTRVAPGLLRRFKDLLVRTGFPSGVELDVAICQGNRWMLVSHGLEDQTFPVLEVKASFLERRRGVGT